MTLESNGSSIAFVFKLRIPGSNIILTFIGFILQVEFLGIGGAMK